LSTVRFMSCRPGAFEVKVELWAVPPALLADLLSTMTTLVASVSAP